MPPAAGVRQPQRCIVRQSQAIEGRTVASAKHEVHLLATPAQLRADVQVRVRHPRRFEQVRADVQWRRVAVVDAEVVERRH